MRVLQSFLVFVVLFPLNLIFSFTHLSNTSEFLFFSVHERYSSCVTPSHILKARLSVNINIIIYSACTISMNLFLFLFLLFDGISSASSADNSELRLLKLDFPVVIKLYRGNQIDDPEIDDSKIDEGLKLYHRFISSAPFIFHPFGWLFTHVACVSFFPCLHIFGIGFSFPGG